MSQWSHTKIKEHKSVRVQENLSLAEDYYSLIEEEVLGQVFEGLN